MTTYKEIRIDTSTPISWANTWVKKARANVAVYREHHSETDFLADFFVGDLPWTETENKAVIELIPQHPEFQQMLAEFEEAFGNSHLAMNFGIMPGLSQPVEM